MKIQLFGRVSFILFCKLKLFTVFAVDVFSSKRLVGFPLKYLFMRSTYTTLEKKWRKVKETTNWNSFSALVIKEISTTALFPLKRKVAIVTGVKFRSIFIIFRWLLYAVDVLTFGLTLYGSRYHMMKVLNHSLYEVWLETFIVVWGHFYCSWKLYNTRTYNNVQCNTERIQFINITTQDQVELQPRGLY